MIDFPSLYGNSITYYGVGFFWTNNAGLPIPSGGVVAAYRTLLGVGV
jgi:hypothetical protein